MKHLLPELHYAPDALAPGMSRETIEFHHGKHLQAYIDNLNRLIAGTQYENMSLEDIVMKSGGAVFNNAAQAWNHTFFFDTLTPVPVPMPERLVRKLDEAFGSQENFLGEFAKAATGLFGYTADPTSSPGPCPRGYSTAYEATTWLHSSQTNHTLPDTKARTPGALTAARGTHAPRANPLGKRTEVIPFVPVAPPRTKPKAPQTAFWTAFV